jgi:GTPase
VFKSGFIAIIGRPNVGKSTLLNSIIGEKLAITTPKPQTTRNRITGIRNVENGQFIFVDTPGIHRASSRLHKYMVDVAIDTLQTVDLILLLIEASAEPHPEDTFILERIKETNHPTFLIINKIDLVRKEVLLPLIDHFRSLYEFREIIPLSARTGDGIPVLLENILSVLPEGPPFFPEDQFTDSSERFLASEIIREKIILLTQQELPYVSAVAIDTFKEDENKNLIRIQATITVEKDSQKGIIIGKRGAKLKEIGTRARLEMERFFAARVYLELFVRVKKDWTQDPFQLKDMGYE